MRATRRIFFLLMIATAGWSTGISPGSDSLEGMPGDTDSSPAQSSHDEVQAGIIRTIVIDAGHGGIDPGALGAGGIREKDITLPISLFLAEKLEKRSGARVFLTRKTDRFVALAARTKFANRHKADLFISIHVNSISASEKNKAMTRGYKVYFLSEAKNEEDKLVAMREDAVINLEERPRHYGQLKNVLSDLAGNEYLRESQDLSILLDRQFKEALSKKIGRLQQGIGQANFWVLNGAYMPSILIETGFISNRSDAKYLTRRSFQREMAEVMCDAVVAFKRKYEKGL